MVCKCLPDDSARYADPVAAVLLRQTNDLLGAVFLRLAYEELGGALNFW
ncbi:MAG: hypothetical protein R6V73_00185 [Anaerolineales bacterium]